MPKKDFEIQSEIRRTAQNTLTKAREEMCTQLAYRGWEPHHAQLVDNSVWVGNELQVSMHFVSRTTGLELSAEDIEMGPKKYLEKHNETTTKH